MGKIHKYYIIYKTTNLVDGKIYIGQHQTDHLDDDYFGSGKLLREAVRQFGKHNFVREILFIFDNFDEMNEKEKELVTPEFVSRDDTYNLIIGGQLDDYEAKKLGAKNANMKKIENGTLHIRPMSMLSLEQQKLAREKAKKTKRRLAANEIHCNKSMLGRHHTDEIKQKIGRANSVHQTGSGNSQFGKHWWHNPTTGETHPFYDKDVPTEWVKGRVDERPVAVKCCPYCGAQKMRCKYPEICSRYQVLKSYKRIFHIGDDIFGSELFYETWFSDISKIITLYRSGNSITQIAKIMNLEIVNQSTLYSCISNMLNINKSPLSLLKQAVLV